jgi:uncharacterized protein involved in outer membrane biogenesis
MLKPLKMTLIALVALVSLMAICAFLLSRVDTKSRFEAMASEVTGMEVAVEGSVSVGIFPTPHVALQQVTISNQQVQIASVGTADAGVAVWPLLRGQVRIVRLALQDLDVAIERDRSGRLNFKNPSAVKRLVPAMTMGHVSFFNTSFRYTNQQADKELKATDCNFDSDEVQLAEGSNSDIMRNLAFAARVVCAEVRNEVFVGTDVDFAVTGEQGRFKITPVTMQILGGKGAGNIDADFTAAVPAYQIHYAVTQLRVENLFKSFAPGKAGEGFLDFTADLSMQGFDADEMTRTAQGEASLRGEDVQLAIGNLDEKLAHYESSQNFNLIDVGAFLVAGPLGTAVTKGYNFASIFQGAQGSTQVRMLLSKWQVEDGIARAQDVVMATRENRLVMKGALDFVKHEFDDVTVAFVDPRGCAVVEQKIVGPFSKPEVRKPNVLISLTGPVTSLIDKAKKIVGIKCEVFYEGSVEPSG